jgi:hypothetical protein
MEWTDAVSGDRSDGCDVGCSNGTPIDVGGTRASSETATESDGSTSASASIRAHNPLGGRINSVSAVVTSRSNASMSSNRAS